MSDADSIRRAVISRLALLPSTDLVLLPGMVVPVHLKGKHRQLLMLLVPAGWIGCLSFPVPRAATPRLASSP